MSICKLSTFNHFWISGTFRRIFSWIDVAIRAWPCCRVQCQYVSTIQAVMGQSIIVSDETVETNECTLDKNWSALDIYYYYVVHHEHVNEHDELRRHKFGFNDTKTGLRFDSSNFWIAKLLSINMNIKGNIIHNFRTPFYLIILLDVENMKCVISFQTI